MSTTIIPDSGYKIHSVEKENDRLIDLVKHTRQNALALVAAVFVVVSTILLSVGEPRIIDLKKAQYEEVFKNRLMGPPQTPERDRAVQRLTFWWDTVTFVISLCGIVIVVLTASILWKTGKYGPDKATLESVTAQTYLVIVMDQFEELHKLHRKTRRILATACMGALVMMVGSLFLILLWNWFGLEAKCLP